MAEGLKSRAVPVKGNTGSTTSKTMSFASVAAMVPLGKGGSRTTSDEAVASTDMVTPAILLRKQDGSSTGTSAESSKALEQSFSRVELKDGNSPVSDLPENDVQPHLPLRSKLDDEKTQLSSFSTTAPSLDGKSVASGTTFGLDEKESLRPDDSASVKATEDDDSNSGPVSGDPNSRGGSEAGMKAFSSQFTEISDKMPPTAPKQFQWVRKPGLSAVDELRRSALASHNPGQPMPQEPSTADMPRPPAPFVYQYQSQPDEKLLEAMESPKDRLFLLQLEQEVISFIRDSAEPLLNLPPCNSFYRLLAHRLGDYYALSHFVDNSVSHVKLYRTPYCQIRTPLSEIAQKLANPVELRPVLTSMKIMRRSANASGDDQTGSGANTTDPSLGPSNTGSEVGDESTKLSGIASPADSIGTKDKAPMSSREEREAKYKEARERIFSDFKEGDKAEQSIEEGLADTQAQLLAAGKKKKKNRQFDDSFDSRSQYNLYYPGGYRPGQIFDPGAPPMANFNGYMQQPGASMYPQVYSQPYQQYPPMPMPQQMSGQMPGYQVPIHQNGPMMPLTGMYQQQALPQSVQQHQYGPSMPQPFYNPYQQQPQQMPGQPASLPSPAVSNQSAQSSRPQSQMSDQTWSHGSYHPQYVPFPGPQGVYPAPPQTQVALGGASQTAMPYPYGQLPFQPTGSGSRPAHPVPGSYNRQNFNPQSRIFIPGQFEGAELHAEQYHANANTAYSGYYPANGPAPQVGQMRTPSNTSLGSSPLKVQTQPGKSQSPVQSSLSKWGTPANLPPKPPPPATTDDNNDEHKAAEQPQRNGI